MDVCVDTKSMVIREERGKEKTYIRSREFAAQRRRRSVFRLTIEGKINTARMYAREKHALGSAKLHKHRPGLHRRAQVPHVRLVQRIVRSLHPQPHQTEGEKRKRYDVRV